MTTAIAIVIAGVFLGLRGYRAEQRLTARLGELVARLDQAEVASLELGTRVQRLEANRTEAQADSKETCTSSERHAAPVAESTPEGGLISETILRRTISEVLAERENHAHAAEFARRVTECARQHGILDENRANETCLQIVKSLTDLREQYWDSGLPPRRESARSAEWIARRDAAIEVALTQLAALVPSQTRHDSTLLLYCVIDYAEWNTD